MMTADIRTITDRWWQPKQGALGEVVLGLDDVDQCILTILTTEPGEDYLRPRFVLRLLDYLDKPINQVRGKLVRAILDAIATWEPRARVLRVEVDQPAIYQLRIGVLWEPVAGGAARTTTATLGAPVAPPVVASLWISSAWISSAWIL